MGACMPYWYSSLRSFANIFALFALLSIAKYAKREPRKEYAKGYWLTTIIHLLFRLKMIYCFDGGLCFYHKSFLHQNDPAIRRDRQSLIVLLQDNCIE